MDVTAHAIDGGFADPVFNAQTVFRAVMDAMARPGTIQPMPGLARPPEPLASAAGAVALTLCDNDTPVWLDHALQAAPAIKAWLGFHSGAPLANTPADAHFALVAAPGPLDDACPAGRRLHLGHAAAARRPRHRDNRNHRPGAHAAPFRRAVEAEQPAFPARRRPDPRRPERHRLPAAHHPRQDDGGLICMWL